MQGGKRGAIELEAWPSVVDEARRAYNVPLARSEHTAVDSRGGSRLSEDVGQKTAAFVRCFSPSIVVTDLLSQKVILADASSFQKRYHTVFGESGPKLELAIRARVVFQPRGGRFGKSSSTNSLVLDYERHSSLVTPVGPMLDGSLGLRGPRRQDMWALYAVRGSSIDGVWLCADYCDAEASGDKLLERLRASTAWERFAQIVERYLGRDYSELSAGQLHSFEVGSHELQGRRPTQEDQLSLERVHAPQLARPGSSTAQWLGLFDGHGGVACAAFAAAHLHQKLLASDAFRQGAVCEALEEAYRECEASWLASGESNAGACALTALLAGTTMYVAHLGDSRAVLSTGEHGEAVALTMDHKPDEAGERARIERAGGAVVQGGRCWRVTHAASSLMLATSRSFGDRSFKESWQGAAAAKALDAAAGAHAAAEAAAEAAAAAADEALSARSASEAEASSGRTSGAPEAVAQALVAADAAHAAHVAATAAKAAKMGFVEVLPLLSAEPTTMQRPISTADRFLILACDGVWDVLSGQQACDSVRAALEESEGDPNAAARKLAGDAYKANSEDNISVIVCKLRHELV